MSLMKKPTMTGKRIAASQANGTRSRGPSTRAGREQIRDANLRHGFYSQDRDAALRALGEDPAELAALEKAVKEEWRPRTPLQKILVARQVRALWRTNRADRMQEGYALRQAQEVNQTREARMHARMMRLKMTEASLKSLAQSVAKEYYVTAAKDLALMQSLHQEGEVPEIGAMAVALFCQLLPPGAAPGEPDEEEKLRLREIQSRNALQRIKEIFGLAGDHPPAPIRTIYNSGQTAVAPLAPPQSETPTGREVDDRAQRAAAARMQAEVAPEETAEAKAKRLYPKITVEEWYKREPVRQLLENLLTRQSELCQIQGIALLRESLNGPSRYERAAEIAPSHPNVRLIQRIEDSSFRQIARITSLLIKIQRRAGQNKSRKRLSRSLNANEKKVA